MSERPYPVPEPHWDSWVNQIHGYVTHVVETLVRAGVPVVSCWLDPSGPRDATIVMRSGSGLRALVWDEETGWRVGGFQGGRQGVRTDLDGIRYLHGDVLLDGDEVLARMPNGVSETRHTFRSHTHYEDGFAARLASYAPASAAVAA